MSGPPAIAAVRRAAWVRSLARLGSTSDYLLTFGAEFTVLGATLLTLRLAAGYWEPMGFGEYVVGRRTLALVQLPIACGIPVALMRFLARLGAEQRASLERPHVVAGVAIAVSGIAVAVAAASAFPSWWADVLLGDPNRVPLLRAVTVAMAGVVLHGVVIGTLRGKRWMSSANLLQVVNLGALPVLALSLGVRSPHEVIALMGGAWCTVSLLALAAVLSRMSGPYVSRQGSPHAARALFWYGAPRVPGEFALGALTALPVTLATHKLGIIAAGFVSLGVSLSSMVASLFAPLGQILLPAVAARAARFEGARLRDDAFRVTGVCLALAALLVVALELTAGWLIPMFLGAEYAAAVRVIRVMLLGTVPYVAYIVLRAVLDALHTRPLNAKNLAIGLVALLVVAAAADSAVAIGWAFACALGLVGLLSVLDARRVLTQLRGE